jgi:hypothetical protein
MKWEVFALISVELKYIQNASCEHKRRHSIINTNDDDSDDSDDSRYNNM